MGATSTISVSIIFILVDGGPIYSSIVTVDLFIVLEFKFAGKTNSKHGV